MSTSRTPANQRQRTWRAQAVQPEQRVRRRRVFRVLLPLVGVGLLGLLAWVLIAWYLRPPKLNLIAIAVADYRNPEAPPIPYCYEDLEALRAALDAGDSQGSSWNDASTDGISQLRTALRERSSSHDNLLIYIKAHGVSLQGRAYLLGGDFELRVADAGRLSVEQLLADVAESPARIKLLVLDTGHVESDPRMGMLTNEFTQLLTEAVAQMPADNNVWVLTSNSLFEQAQVSLKDGRSAFGYYLAEGLKGKADGILADDDGQKKADQLVQLDELYRYVREHVIQYARLTSSDRQSQTPLLLRSGKGQVTEGPHEVLLRLERVDAPEAKDKEVASRGASTRSAGLTSTTLSVSGRQRRAQVPSTMAMALVGNQNPAAESSGSATADDKQAESSAAAQPASAKADAEPAKGNDGKAAAGKEATAAKDDRKDAQDAAKSETSDGAKKATAEPAAKPPARPRLPVQQHLFDHYTRLENEQRDEDLWRPIDYAPDLARLYYESLAGCRDRAVAGHLFLNVPGYQRSLDNKLKELAALQARMDERRARFVGGAARPTYERDGAVRAAIRLRNDACHLIPLLVAQHARTSATTQPTMQGELNRVIAAALELDRLIAYDPQTSEPAQPVEGWKQALRAQENQLRATLRQLQEDFEKRSQQQQRLIGAEANQAVARALADLALSPLATADDREQLHDAAHQAARSFAEVEKEGAVTLRRPSTADRQRLADLGWQRALDRANLELALAAFVVDKQGQKLEELRTEAARGVGLADSDSRLALARRIGEFLDLSYRNVPDQLKEQLKSNRYDAWRAAETAIRLADARDQRRIEAVLREPVKRAWTDPVAGVPLRALPEVEEGYWLAVGNGSGTLNRPLELNYEQLEALTLRFQSNTALPERLRLKLTYDRDRAQVRNAQGTELYPGTIWELTGGRGSSAFEQSLELRLASRDQSGGQSNLSLSWLDESDREVAQATAVLAHPEPEFLQLAVQGQRGTVDSSLRGMAVGTMHLDHVRLLPFPGHDTRYDFRLTNNARYPKKYSVAVYTVPPPGDAEQTRSPESLVMSAERSGKRLVSNELTIGPGGTESLDFFSSQPAGAATAAAAAPDAAKADTAKSDAAKEPPPDISHGLVCVLTEDAKPTDGAVAAKPRRQVIVVEIEPQLPQGYIARQVRYDGGDASSARITVKVAAEHVELLPPAGSTVELEVVGAEHVAHPSAKWQTTLTQQNREDELTAFVKPGTSSGARVLLHVDGYPRAFIYELALDAGRSNALQKLWELREIMLPDEKTVPRYYREAVTEPLRFPFSVDMPPSRDRSYLARLFIGRQSGGETYNPRADTLVLESFQDRIHRAALIQPEGSPGMAVRMQTSDLVAMLPLRGYRNQPVHVRVQLVRREQGAETVLGGAGEKAHQQVVLYIDNEPPVISTQGPIGFVYEARPFEVKLNAHDQVSGVRQVEFALKKQSNPDPQAREEELLVEPKQARRLQNDAFQFSHTFEKPGDHSLWIQATDMSGNKSEIKEVLVKVWPIKPAAADKGAPVAQFGQIVGRAVLPDGAPGNIKKIVLSDSEGKLVKELPNSADGRFVFDKLRPGDYIVSAEGTVANQFGKPVPVKVTVEAGKKSDPITVLLGR